MPFDTQTLILLLIGGVAWLLLSYGTYRIFAAEPLPESETRKETEPVWLERTLTRRILSVVFAPILWSGGIIFAIGAVLYIEGRKLLSKLPNKLSTTRYRLHRWWVGRHMRKIRREIARAEKRDKVREKRALRRQRRGPRPERVRARRARFLSGETGS